MENLCGPNKARSSSGRNWCFGLWLGRFEISWLKLFIVVGCCTCVVGESISPGGKKSPNTKDNQWSSVWVFDARMGQIGEIFLRLFLRHDPKMGEWIKETVEIFAVDIRSNRIWAQSACFVEHWKFGVNYRVVSTWLLTWLRPPKRRN